VYAIIPTGIATKNWLQLGATPSSMLSTSVCGLRISTKPSRTSKSCVAKSTTARKTFRLAASRTPTMLIPTRRTMTTAPPTMSQGFSFSGSQKTER
jgi:hypothetical protein